MSSTRKSTKARLIEAALDLFAEKGVTETTTKAVAQRAQVNEVTLFRKFGSKHRLMLAVIEDSAIFTNLVHGVVNRANTQESLAQFIKIYASESLRTLAKAPELIRSVVGEAGNYPLENRLALGKGLTEANRCLASYLAEAIAKQGWQPRLSSEQIVSLLNGLLIGYFIIKTTCEGYEGYELWESEEEFLDGLVTLLTQGTITPTGTDNLTTSNVHQVRAGLVPPVKDLPASLVRSLLKQAKKLGKQEYALAYVLFGAGLTVEEVINLKPIHSIVEPQKHLLFIEQGAARQVPLNQWIMGFKYGSSSNNPLTQWLKTSKDEQATIFINESQQPLSVSELQALWQVLTAELVTPQGKSPTIEQARDTWCVEMLSRGVDLDNLSILSGLSREKLQLFAAKAKNKIAIEEATLLDQKPKLAN